MVRLLCVRSSNGYLIMSSQPPRMGKRTDIRYQWIIVLSPAPGRGARQSGTRARAGYAPSAPAAWSVLRAGTSRLSWPTAAELGVSGLVSGCCQSDRLSSATSCSPAAQAARFLAQGRARLPASGTVQCCRCTVRDCRSGPMDSGEVRCDGRSSSVEPACTARHGLEAVARMAAQSPIDGIIRLSSGAP